ncbi:hypothetical protein Bphy_4818 [Paraburkholderia phymatum STM815]|uniref:Uncharacterized protein n=1 Tax=Paraburkholderia phymatum (strain DSM 17167 / CIP 108236 / LMG 21445 / STM815) TaxID=391038 RepID=B2JS07_PARP8|nr:hypothetical protein Bphy_4818 [Paraburkholderia phymatum STM815]
MAASPSVFVPVIAIPIRRPRLPSAFGARAPYLLTSIALAVVGGTLMTGGRGNYAGMLGGALPLTALATFLSGSAMPSAARSLVYRAVVLAAVVAMRDKRIA